MDCRVRGSADVGVSGPWALGVLCRCDPWSCTIRLARDVCPDPNGREGDYGRQLRVSWGYTYLLIGDVALLCYGRPRWRQAQHASR